jgi:hypothetical protein
MGQRGREKVCQQFDWEVKVDRIMELYRQAMAEYATTETTATQPVAAIQP